MSEDEKSSGKKQIKGLTIDPELVPDEETLAKFADYPMLLMECVRIMLEKCSENAVMFRKCGGAQCVHSLVMYDSSRGEALKIIQELILNGGRDDLGWFAIFLLVTSFGTFDDVLCQFTAIDVIYCAQPKSPQTCCKLSILPACCNLSKSYNKLINFIKVQKVCN